MKQHVMMQQHKGNAATQHKPMQQRNTSQCSNTREEAAQEMKQLKT